jgi:hypothetical protein
MFTKTSTTLSIVVSSVVLISILVTTIPQNDSVYSVSAQVNNSNNTNSTSMNFAMEELAKLHLMIADRALKKANTTEAFNQMNLAYLQLSMLGMKDMGTLNQTQAMKCVRTSYEMCDVQGGGGVALVSRMVPDNCIIIQGGVLKCRDILTASYSLAK